MLLVLTKLEYIGALAISAAAVYLSDPPLNSPLFLDGITSVTAFHLQ